MILNEGDYVTGKGIPVGEYLGIDELTQGTGGKFHKIYDLSKKATHYVPLNSEGNLRKLPTKTTIMKNLKIFESDKTIDIGEVDGSRYRYFNEKLDKMTFKAEMEVLHDLVCLKKDKSTSVSENKLLISLREKVVNEMSHILASKSDEVEKLLILQ